MLSLNQHEHVENWVVRSWSLKKAISKSSPCIKTISTNYDATVDDFSTELFLQYGMLFGSTIFKVSLSIICYQE